MSRRRDVTAMEGLTRRRLLIGAGQLAAGAALASLPGCGQSARGATRQSISLDAQWIDKIFDGTRVRLRSYNGTVPGPSMEFAPGNQLDIVVRNSLTPYDSSAWDGTMNIPHDLNTTNLHLHGVQVVPHLFDPVGTVDPNAELIGIQPGQEYRYHFDVPEDQPAGFYWYHPHHHGATVVQAVSGMAGVITIRGDIDEVPEIAAAREIVVAVQDIGLFPSEEEPDLWIYEPRQNAIWNTLESQVLLDGEPSDLLGGWTAGDYKRRFYLVNGEPFFREDHNYDDPTMPLGQQLPVPRYQVRPGEVVRFRMLNGTSDDVIPLVVDGHAVHVIGMDGINYPELRSRPPAGSDAVYGDEQILLAPGNRAEFLLRGGAPGVYPIRQLAQSAQFLESDARVIAEIEVSGTPMSMSLPTSLPVPAREYPLIRDDEISARRDFTFSSTIPGVLNPVVGSDFMINGVLYEEDRIDVTAQVGAAEEWTLHVPDSDHGGIEGHPFHIHTNSFEVISVAGVAQEPGTIRDTIWMPKNSEVVIRIRFKQWTGKAVYHCHILPHEDTGMMQNILYV